MGGGAGAPPVGTVAVAICPNPPTQNISGASPSAGGSVVSELLMSVGAPRAGARVSNTPATTARRPARARAGQAPGTRPPPAPKCKVGARVVVERKHLHYRVKPQEPARAVLDQHNLVVVVVVVVCCLLFAVCCVFFFCCLLCVVCLLLNHVYF